MFKSKLNIKKLDVIKNTASVGIEIEKKISFGPVKLRYFCLVTSSGLSSKSS